MSFNSLFYTEIFLVSALTIYYLVKIISKNNKLVLNITLLVLSLFFYLWKAGFIYFSMMIGVSVLNYFIARYVGKTKSKPFLVIGIVLNTVYLFFFKYCNAIISVTGSTWYIVFPLAISFITFHSISYLVDSYRDKVDYKNVSVIDYGLYIFLFMKLVEGPISRYDRIKERNESLSLFSSGILKFGFGLAKKVIIADTLGTLTATVYSNSATIGTGLSWLAVLAYALQIYFDFSGYCDMAICVGRMFGYDLEENFDLPYTALSIQGFWRKWHITLSKWFKEYIYIPLGGNRKGLARTLLNIFIIFVLTGIWHGNQITFLFWGIYFALFMIIERLFLGKLLERNKLKFINSIYVLVVVALGWVIFRSYSIETMANMFRNLFTYQPNTSESSFVTVFTFKVLLMIILGIILSGPGQLLYNLLPEKIRNSQVVYYGKYVICFALILFASIFMASNSFSPSLYGDF